MLDTLLHTPRRIWTATAASWQNKPQPQLRAPNQMIDDGRSSNVEQLADSFTAIPGMLPRQRGMTLYSLAFGQSLRGDIVEIGSWQGRSTCFLAQACKDAGNGIVRAVDHFQGNAHSRSAYVVDRDDLSDLPANFRRNVEGAGLADYVQLYQMTSAEASAKHASEFDAIRMLFIDGDHSYAGATGDIDRFAPLLMPGGLIVFDDYHSDGPELVRAVRQRILDSGEYGHFIQFQGILIARKLD